jgi:hypothetical protein
MSEDKEKYKPFEGNDRPSKDYIDPSISFKPASDLPYVRTTKTSSEDVEILKVEHENCHRGEGLTEDGQVVIYDGGCPYGGQVAIAKYRITDSKDKIRDRIQRGYYCEDCMDEMENKYNTFKYLKRLQK